MNQHSQDGNNRVAASASHEPGALERVVWSLPWLTRYPFWRMGERARQLLERSRPEHIIFVMANHFEPAWNPTLSGMSVKAQLARLDEWHREARVTASLVQDADGMPFRHTYFYPAEQYERTLLEKLADMQAEELGEVEVHLHHGVERPDTAASLRGILEEFRDLLAQEHKCLSQSAPGKPAYAFIHGNWALANSAGGRFCGVDSEMQILAETGCYADFTLPSIFSPAQVSRINTVYQCGGALNRRAPHRTGPELRVGSKPILPVLITGPTVFDWRRRKGRLPLPRVDDGVVTASYPLDRERLDRWRSARVGVRGRPEWVFIKLHCHGFFQLDQPVTIGEPMRRFLGEVLEVSQQAGFKVHFATAREAFNIVLAAVDGHSGEPGIYRDYRLRQIMKQPTYPVTCQDKQSVSTVLTVEQIQARGIGGDH